MNILYCVYSYNVILRKMMSNSSHIPPTRAKYPGSKNKIILGVHKKKEP